MRSRDSRPLHLKDRQTPARLKAGVLLCATILLVTGRCKLRVKWIVCAMIFCLSLIAKGQSQNGETLTSPKLREYCALVGLGQTKLSNDDYDHRNICLFYVSGVLDGFQIGDSTTKICIPSEASLGELALVVSKYLNQHPERLHNPPQYLVIDALHAAFPCETATHK